MPSNDDRKRFGGRNWGDTSSDTSAGRGIRETQTEPQNDGARINEMVDRAEPMIEQINNLYAMYLQGIEKLPPNEKRAQLEALMNQIMQAHKPSSAYRFRAETVTSKFALFKEKWDKMIRDLESGKVKRVVKGKS